MRLISQCYTMNKACPCNTEMNMTGAKAQNVLTLHSCSEFTTKNKETFRRRRKYNTLRLKCQKSALCFVMFNLVSHIPTGFSIRYAFSVLIVQFLVFSNYLDITGPRNNLLAEAIRIDSIEFPSHVLFGHPVIIYDSKSTIYLFC